MAHSKTKRTAAAALTILIMALALAWQGDKSPPPPATAPPAETPVPPRETARNLTATADLAIGQPDAGTSLPPATSGGNPLVDLPSVQAPRRPAAAPDFSTPNGEEAAFGLEATQGQAGYAKETIPFTWLAFSHLHEISISHTEDEWQRGVVAGNSAGGTAGPEHDDAVTTATGESTPQQPAPDWTTVGVQGHSGQAGFSLMLPPGWNFTKLKGRDSYVAQITGESVNLLLDYGWYSWDLDLKTRPDPGREYVELREYIGGLPAKVLLSKDPSGGHTGVYIENFGNPMDGLLILGWGLTPEQQDTALTIFPSIRVITPPPSQQRHQFPAAAIPAIANATNEPAPRAATSLNALTTHAPKEPVQEDGANKTANYSSLSPATADAEQAALPTHCPNQEAQLAYHLLLSRYPALAESNPPCLWEPQPRYPRDNSTKGS